MIKKTFGKQPEEILGKNRWLSLSTIFVITIVFTISTFFIISAIVARQAVSYYETKAQVMVFFKKETPEEEIFKIRDQIQQLPNIEGIEYISQEKAYEIYKQDFQNDQDLVDTITADVLPPSLGIRAKSIDDLTVVINKINDEKDKNAYIDEVWYFEDVVNSLKSISKVIDYGAIALISILGVIAFTLIC
jgi:cell division protein FtsX